MDKKQPEIPTPAALYIASEDEPVYEVVIPALMPLQAHVQLLTKLKLNEREHYWEARGLRDGRSIRINQNAWVFINVYENYHDFAAAAKGGKKLVTQ